LYFSLKPATEGSFNTGLNRCSASLHAFKPYMLPVRASSH
jgi:hypothetical protein